jgi:transposase InsO family protein
MPDWTDKTYPEVFFTTCEKLLTTAGIDRQFWSGQVVHKLPEKALAVYTKLPLLEANDYDKLKAAILDVYVVSADIYRRNLFAWTKLERQTYAEHVDALNEQFQRWTEVKEVNTFDDLKELLLEYRLDSQLSDDQAKFILDKKPCGLKSWVRLLDDYAVSQKVFYKSRQGPTKKSDPTAKQGNGQTYRSGQAGNTAGQNHKAGTTSHQDRSQASGGKPYYNQPSGPKKAPVMCEYCKKLGHDSQRCYTNPHGPAYRGNQNVVKSESANSAPPGPGNRSTSGLIHTACTDTTVHPLYHEYTGEIYVSSAKSASTPEVKAVYLRDTGSTISLIHNDILARAELNFTGDRVSLMGVNQVTGVYDLAEIYVKCSFYEGALLVAVIPHMPLPGVQVLIGNDIGKQPAITPRLCGGVVTRAASRKQVDLPEDLNLSSLWESNPDSIIPLADTEISVASDTDAPAGLYGGDVDVIRVGLESDEGATVCDETQPNSLFVGLDTHALCDSQLTDETLVALWNLAEHSEPSHAGYYVSPGGVLMRKDSPLHMKPDQDWLVKHQIVVPVKYRLTILNLAHDVYAGGHSGPDKVIVKIKENFFWPGLRRDVKRHCSGCPQCQRLGKGVKPVTAPLKPLPVIGKAFDYISCDFVGPLPETSSGHRYLLNVIDHATKYAESFPLKSADAESTIGALTELFSRHGLPGRFLTDRGSTFVSTAMEDFLSKLGIKHLTTSPYRPQTNGTCEKFNGTLKTMVKAVVDEFGGDWDQALPWLMFAYRSNVHRSTGFSPFFLLYGRETRGPLQALFDTWVAPDQSEVVPISDYVHSLCTRIKDALDRAQVSMTSQADERKVRYDKRSRLVEYQPGDSVLVRLPLAGKPLVGAWQGPYLIKSQLGSHTYAIYMHDKRIKNRITHVNAIKKWHEPQQTVGVCVESPESDDEEGDREINYPPEVPTVTDLEVRYDPGTYWVNQCRPSGDLPDISQLTDEQQRTLLPLFERYPSLFGGALGIMKGVYHDIDVGDHPPIRQNFYRVSPAQQELLRHEVDEMLSLGVIQPSQSSWGSPLILVKKPDGSWRPCVDYRRVNLVSKGDAYPLPRLDDLVDRLGGAKFISTLDANKGYWQVRLTDRAREISAFVTPFGHYEFLSMPFGVKNGPRTYQRAMNQLLGGLEEYAAAYLDDLSIKSDTWELHLTRLEQVFARLEAHGVTLNAKKCVFGGSTVNYLGHEVGSGHVAPSTAKVSALKNVPPPAYKKKASPVSRRGGILPKIHSSLC